MDMRSTERFSTRVEAYREHRPRYPREIVDVLRRECGLAADWVIADVAAGTGILAEVFLAGGNRVIAIEPNAPMRTACQRLEAKYPKLKCLSGTAETTGLADGSIDMITVGQAMHWFDLDATRREFARVLKPGGWCVVVYNHRKMSGDAFHEGYERILEKYGKDYRSVQSSHLGPDTLAAFFAPSEMHCAAMPNRQDLTLERLRGRVLSSSYMPQEGDAEYPAMMEAVNALFREHARSDMVRMEYETAVCWGKSSAR